MSIADRLSRQSPRAQRILALVALPTALLSIVAGVIWPIWHTYQVQIQWRIAVTRSLAHQRGLAAIESAVRSQLDALPNLRSWQKFYRANAESSAVIALQSDVSGALAASHARPQSFSPIGTQTGPLRKVGLRVAASMTIDQLREFLLQADALAHFVRIERLLVNTPPQQSPQENPMLTVTMDVFGFVVDDASLKNAALAQSRSN